MRTPERGKPVGIQERLEGTCRDPLEESRGMLEKHSTSK